MNEAADNDTDRMVYLRASRSVLVFVLHAAWQTVRVSICALLALIEPILRRRWCRWLS